MKNSSHVQLYQIMNEQVNEMDRVIQVSASTIIIENAVGYHQYVNSVHHN